MKFALPAALITLSAFLISCNNSNTTSDGGNMTDTSHATTTGETYDPNFVVEAEAFADLQVLRYEVPGFNSLPLNQKKLAYYLYEAALCGRDIIYDQKSKNGLLIRKMLETIYETANTDRNADDWFKF